MINRISREQMWMNMAEAASRRSTCMRRSVGAVIVDNTGRYIMSIGYNGPPSGEPHCTGNGCDTDGVCVRSVHAEKNAIERIPYDDKQMINKQLFTTESPCQQCAELIVGTLIGRVYYLHEYRIPEPIKYLIDHGIHVFRMTPSGYIVNRATNELETTT